MEKQVNSVAVQSILYGVYKAIHKIAGPSAPAVMRQAAQDMLEGLARFRGTPMITNIDELQKAIADTVVHDGCCEKMEFSLDGENLTAKITDCTFHQLTCALKDDGIEQNFGCPFAVLTLGLAERCLGKKARITHLAPTEGGNPGDTTLVVTMKK